MSNSEDLPEDGSRREATDGAPSARGDDARHRTGHFRHTRTSAAWLSVVVAIVFGVALIDFIAQNTRDVHIEFFSASGRMPIAVALLVAALCGAIVVVAVGIGRVAQLRLTMRRQRRQHDAERDVKN